MLRFGLVLGGLACAPPVPEESPLEGPGFDPVTGALTAEGESFVVALTHLQVRNLPGPGRRFGDHAQTIGNYLFEEEPAGWLGAAFRNVGRLDWWTITVWDSEQAMLEFVVSPPHAYAMAEFSDITVGGESRSIEIGPEALPIPWSDALGQLLSEPDFVHGDSDWYATEAP
ncbi:MAG: hypothetical protein AAF602_15950 [Myxococcota bacterium]